MSPTPIQVAAVKARSLSKAARSAAQDVSTACGEKQPVGISAGSVQPVTAAEVVKWFKDIERQKPTAINGYKLLLWEDLEAKLNAQFAAYRALGAAEHAPVEQHQAQSPQQG